MVRLLLLRHAEALPHSSDGDFSRALSPRGLADASRLGAFLRARKITPDATIASAARRTRETTELVLAELPDAPAARFEKELYNASAERLLEAFSHARGETILIVAHNPGVAELVQSLSSRAGEQIALRVEPCALAIFEADAKLPQGRGMRLVNFVTPAQT